MLRSSHRLQTNHVRIAVGFLFTLSVLTLIFSLIFVCCCFVLFLACIDELPGRECLSYARLCNVGEAIRGYLRKYCSWTCVGKHQNIHLPTYLPTYLPASKQSSQPPSYLTFSLNFSTPKVIISSAVFSRAFYVSN